MNFFSKMLACFKTNYDICFKLINQQIFSLMNTLSINPKVRQVIETLKQATNKSVTGVSFVSIRNYTNKSGETSNNLINIGASYDRAKKRDIEFLENFDTSAHDFKSAPDLIEEARIALIAAFLKPNLNRSKGQANALPKSYQGSKFTTKRDTSMYMATVNKKQF